VASEAGVESGFEVETMKPSSTKYKLSEPNNASSVRKRGRPRKASKTDDKDRDYWFGEVFIHYGWAWGTELVEVEPGEGETRRWDVLPLCLGREENIVPILKGEVQIPEDMHPRRKALLASILEVNINGRFEAGSRAFSVQRGSHARALRHGKGNVRRLKARERLSLRKA